jgi:hypothetical protein
LSSDSWTASQGIQKFTPLMKWSVSLHFIKSIGPLGGLNKFAEIVGVETGFAVPRIIELRRTGAVNRLIDQESAKTSFVFVTHGGLIMIEKWRNVIRRTYMVRHSTQAIAAASKE